MITACTPGPAQDPALGIEYEKPLPFLPLCSRKHPVILAHYKCVLSWCVLMVHRRCR